MGVLVAPGVFLGEFKPKQKLIARTRKTLLKRGITTKFLPLGKRDERVSWEMEEFELNSCFLGESYFLVILSAILVECYECKACTGL